MEIIAVFGWNSAFQPSYNLSKSRVIAVEMGAKPVLEPTTEPWGQRTCYIADPDGNLIEISSFNP